VLLTLLGDMRLAALESAQVRRFVAQLHARGLAPRSLASLLSAWRGLYRWLVRHRGYVANPVEGVRAPKPPKRLPKALSVEQMQRLLEAQADGAPGALRDRAMFELMYSSGLRLAELVQLDVGDGRLDLREGEVTVTGKGSKTRTVPVGARARQALQDWIGVRAQLGRLTGRPPWIPASRRPLPTASTTPEASWPGMSGSRTTKLPFRPS